MVQKSPCPRAEVKLCLAYPGICEEPGKEPGEGKRWLEAFPSTGSCVSPVLGEVKPSPERDILQVGNFPLS